MSLSESSALPSADVIYDWCQNGFVYYQRGSHKESRKARNNLHKHLHTLTKAEGHTSHTLPTNVKTKIQTALATMTGNSSDFYHKFPIQSFILINRELTNLPDDPENASMQSIAAIKKAYEEYRRLHTIEELEDKEVRLKKRTALYRSQSTRSAESNPTTSAYHQASAHTVITTTHELKDNRPIRNSCRWCTWAKRSCQTLWKKIFKR